MDHVEQQKIEEAREKEELKRRSWIKIRDDYLNSKK